MRVIKKLLLIVIVTMMGTMNAQAQNDDLLPRRMDCMRQQRGERETRGSEDYLMPSPKKDWDASRIYRQLVILVEFSDSTFTCANPHEYYDRLFNEQGYNEGVGLGCVADYFRDQSGGLCNLQFDIVGPYRITGIAKKKSDNNYGDVDIVEAINMLNADKPDMDCEPYDWDGDGEIDQVVLVFASYTGNEVSGFMWPNSGYLGRNVTLGGMNIYNISCSCERWDTGSNCGIGTICHEFSHCLGLPDIYPAYGSSTFSVCDEFDLMDGGNYTNRGWCPPNLTAMEKMYLGWSNPMELDESTTINNLASISDGGTSYIIHHTDTEYLLLENRQHKGWDAAIPGTGLVILHVDYKDRDWRENSVNISDRHRGYDIVHADNMDYDDWEKLYSHKDDQKQYADAARGMYNRHLSGSPYPWYNSSTGTENDCLTDTSVPTVVMFNDNAEGSKLFGKSITNIRVADDGTVSFDFTMETTGISEVDQDNGQRSKVKGQGEIWYTIDGRRLAGKPTKPGVYLYQGRKIIEN